MKISLFTTLSRLVQNVASEEAENDLRFSGDDALARLAIPQEERTELRAALIDFSKRGAVRALEALKLHGYLKQ